VSKNWPPTETECKAREEERRKKERRKKSYLQFAPILLSPLLSLSLSIYLSLSLSLSLPLFCLSLPLSLSLLSSPSLLLSLSLFSSVYLSLFLLHPTYLVVAASEVIVAEPSRESEVHRGEPARLRPAHCVAVVVVDDRARDARGPACQRHAPIQARDPAGGGKRGRIAAVRGRLRIAAIVREYVLKVAQRSHNKGEKIVCVTFQNGNFARAFVRNMF
jgi:hypothetical protein